MVTNFPGPYQVDIKYQTTIASVALDHVVRVNCNVNGEPNPGDIFADLDLFTRGGTGVNLQTAVDALVALMIPLFSSADTVVQSAELWEVTPETYLRTFKAAYDISAAGTNGGSAQVSTECIYTFRTIEGGIMKFYMEETIVSSQKRTSYAALAGDINADLMDYIADANTWILGRDTSYPFVRLNFCGGQNEATWRRRNR